MVGEDATTVAGGRAGLGVFPIGMLSSDAMGGMIDGMDRQVRVVLLRDGKHRTGWGYHRSPLGDSEEKICRLYMKVGRLMRTAENMLAGIETVGERGQGQEGDEGG